MTTTTDNTTTTTATKPLTDHAKYWLEKVSRFASADPHRYVLTYPFICPKTGAIVATDTHRLIVVPGIADPSNGGSCTKEGGNLGHLGTYPNFERVIPDPADLSFITLAEKDAERLLVALQALTKGEVSKMGNQRMTLTIGAGQLAGTIAHADVSVTIGPFPCEGMAEGKIAFNHVYLRESLEMFLIPRKNHVAAAPIKIGLNTKRNTYEIEPCRPITIESPEVPEVIEVKPENGTGWKPGRPYRPASPAKIVVMPMALNKVDA